MVTQQRRYVLAGLLVGLGLLTTVLLSTVLATVFFAITVAYVLFPLSEWFTGHGLSERLAAAVTTLVAFVGGSLVLLPPVAVLYFRRRDLLGFLRQIPDSVTLVLGEMRYTVDLGATLSDAVGFLGSFAVGLASAAPILALKVVLFTILVYAMLWQPSAPGRVVYRTVPQPYHDVVTRFHERLRGTLYALYVLQVATAFGTFAMAWVVFALLGYQSAFSLAVVAGILQFVPVVGPSVVVVAIAVADAVMGDFVGAVLVTVLGLVLVGFLPDAVIRPRLARYTTGMPASLYFVGFTGGVLSLGLVGFIAGPVVVALLVEAANLLAEERGPEQQQLS
ncbi:AI-2E family transporter [Haloarcula nitratireducens]|uniref:AI-2E family transporter n=1 Tax=Haloarcula nitratireducens TaxID=2487749 RepID=A0AAW4PCH7_9EURY|nr:AI-2E family transporter [Halomicroarcula nitratireducens]MBX0295590.1 AI-2E family transporter [Halomicroarcula nitratireducens]